jgi:hypothetical protein
MRNPETILADQIKILDKRARLVGLVDLVIAKHLIESGRFYAITTEEIVFT